MSKNNTNTYKGEMIMSNTRKIRATEVAEDRFYKMPKWLIKEESFKGLSNDAKVLYTIMRDRHDLSLSNNWIDSEGFIYMIYTREEMCTDLGVSIKPVINAVKELLKYGLIAEKRQGCNKPNLLYVLTVDLDSQWKCRIDISKYGNIPYPNMEICQPNDTDINKTDFKDTNKNLSEKREVREREQQLSVNLFLAKEHLGELFDYLSDKQKQTLDTWEHERLAKALEIYDKMGGKSFKYLEACYANPIDTKHATTQNRVFKPKFNNLGENERDINHAKLEEDANNHMSRDIWVDEMSDRSKKLLERLNEI